MYLTKQAITHRPGWIWRKKIYRCHLVQTRHISPNRWIKSNGQVRRGRISLADPWFQQPSRNEWIHHKSAVHILLNTFITNGYSLNLMRVHCLLPLVITIRSCIYHWHILPSHHMSGYQHVGERFEIKDKHKDVCVLVGS